MLQRYIKPLLTLTVVSGMLQSITPAFNTVRDNSNTYECIATYQPDTKSNPNPNPDPNPNPTTKQHAIVNIQLNIVTCPTYPDERDMLLHRLCDFRL